MYIRISQDFLSLHSSFNFYLCVSSLTFANIDACLFLVQSKLALRAVMKPNKALPDFNEAFGSTERGRFQSPPDPRLGPGKGYLDYFFPSNGLKYEDYKI